MHNTLELIRPETMRLPLNAIAHKGDSGFQRERT